jgi:hypothetical protein
MTSETKQPPRVLPCISEACQARRPPDKPFPRSRLLPGVARPIDPRSGLAYREHELDPSVFTRLFVHAGRNVAYQL